MRCTRALSCWMLLSIRDEPFGPSLFEMLKAVQGAKAQARRAIEERGHGGLRAATRSSAKPSAAWATIAIGPPEVKMMIRSDRSAAAILRFSASRQRRRNAFKGLPILLVVLALGPAMRRPRRKSPGKPGGDWAELP